MQMVPDCIPDEACANPAIRQIKRLNYPERLKPSAIAGKYRPKSILQRRAFVRWHGSREAVTYRVFT
jgi:hypothetical protein